MALLLILFLASGAIMIGLSVPLILCKVPPNSLYGFRVRQTLEDPLVWYVANAYSAWRFLWLGASIIIVAATAFFVPGLEVAGYGALVGVVMAVGLIASLIQSFHYLRKMTEHQDK